MKEARILNALGQVDDKYIEEAAPETKARRRSSLWPLWSKWAAAAACLALLILGIHFAAPLIFPKGGPGQDDPTRPLNALEFNGAYYEVLDPADTARLDRCRLPREITPEMVGKALGPGLDKAGQASPEIFHIYLPYAHIFTVSVDLSEKRPQRAVYVVQRGQEYAFALFSAFVSFDANTHQEAREMLAVYGIDEAQDIASLKLGEKKIAEPAEIARFFNSLLQAKSMGNEDFQAAVFGGLSAEKEQALHEELADSASALQITTRDGLVINNIRYYPTIRYIRWGLNYYHLAEALN